MKIKAEVFQKFVEYEAMATAQFKCKIGSFLCDNGGEYINSDFLDFCRSKGIRTLRSVPYNHQQNGRAERLNRTLEDRARTLLMESGMPKSFWSAILCANYTLNRCPTSSTGRVPAVEWYQTKVNYGKLRPFGCVCYVHIPKEKRQKFDSHSAKGMVGYAPIGYRIYDLESKTVRIARNVLFDENLFYKDLAEHSEIFKRASVTEGTCCDDELAEIEQEPTETVDTESSEVPVVRQSSRERKRPSYLDDYEVTIGYCEALLTENSSDPKWNEPKRAEKSRDQLDALVWCLGSGPTSKRYQGATFKMGIAGKAEQAESSSCCGWLR